MKRLALLATALLAASGTVACADATAPNDAAARAASAKQQLESASYTLPTSGTSGTTSGPVSDPTTSPGRIATN